MSSKLVVAILCLFATCPVYADNASNTVPAFQSALVPRLFPELDSFWKDNGARWPSGVAANISKLQTDRQNRQQQSFNCTPKPLCTIQSMIINNEDAATLTQALEASNASASLLQVWPQYINATNRMLKVYGNGTAPMYPDIDAINYPANSSDYILFLNTLQTWSLSDKTGSRPPPWDAIDYALTMLDANDRTNALYFTDLWQRQNALALARSRSLDWSGYQYAAILIPGFGPEIYGVPLSFLGKMRVRIAVAEFRRGVAPFIIPSGGNVHPNQTTYNEALEMGEWLVSQYGVSNESVAIEPNARHTTTNLRNAARVLQALGAPASKQVLIISDKSQRDDIASEAFANRCMNELGYVTGDIGSELGDFGVEWTPNRRNELIDPIDPLDP